MESARTVRTWRRRAADTRDSVRFRLRPPVWADEITAELPFGEPAAERFLADLAACRRYLEFGSGASTLRAVEAPCAVVTVESDRAFLHAVEGRCRLIGAASDAGAATFIHADIGPTGPWGVPARKAFTGLSGDRWRAYPTAPWVALGREYRADLVLVDGRFRVACALSVILMQRDTDWQLLFDDYVDRQEYWPIERFADLVEMRGRMAVFRPRADLDVVEAGKAFEAFVSDWR